MGESYPRRDQARGLWKINDITKNIKEEGTYPQTSSQNTAIYSGGATPSSTVTMDTFQINTAGNAVDFGDLAVGIRPTANAGDFIRCIICGGGDPDVNTIQYVNYATKGNTADFGDDQNTRQWKGGGGSNGVRSVWGGGNPEIVNISSIVVQSLGDAVDYGDLTQATYGSAFGTNGNNTTAAFSGGYTPSSNTNRIDTKDITSSGDTIDFGDLTVSYRYRYATNSATKNFIAGGEGTTVIDVFTLGSKGNSVDFGDITASKSKGTGVSNGITGVYGGGNTYPAEANVNVIESFSMSTFGNTSDFGDLTSARQLLSSNSNGHGGLQEQSQRAPELYSPTGKPLRSGAVGVGDLWMYARNGALEFGSVTTTGKGIDFGDCSQGILNCSSSTRGIHGKANVSSSFTEYVEYSTKGNAAFFGDATVNRQSCQGGSNSTRGMFFGGETPSSSDVIDYITIATIGNSTDFGNLTQARGDGGTMGNSTRMTYAGGYGAPAYRDIIDYVTIASTGNATDFGDATFSGSLFMRGPSGSTTRGILGGGYNPANRNDIQYITIASTGNATDFGDLTQARSGGGGAGNGTRGLFLAGYTPSDTSTIDYITIASTGNATDYGDTVTAGQGAGSSNCHGGLS